MSETEKKRIYLDLFESSPVKSDYSDPMGLVDRAEEDTEFSEPDSLPDSKWQLAANMLLQHEALHFALCYLASEADGSGLSYEEIKSRCEGFLVPGEHSTDWDLRFNRWLTERRGRMAPFAPGASEVLRIPYLTSEVAASATSAFKQGLEAGNPRSLIEVQQEIRDEWAAILPASR